MFILLLLLPFFFIIQGLLIKSRLEYEKSRTKERATLQLQALVDQHTNSLTLTQSTFDAVENSAPACKQKQKTRIPPFFYLYFISIDFSFNL